MTRDDFILDRTAYYIGQGLDLHAARLMASGIAGTHWPLSAPTAAEVQKDTDEERAHGWAAQ